MSTRFYLFIFVALFLSTMPVLANTDMPDGRCFETSASINGAQLFPYMYHHWDQSGAIEIPELTAGHELTQTTRGFSFTPLANTDIGAVLDNAQTDHWFVLCLRNMSNQTHDLVLTVEPPILLEVDFYPQKPGLASFKTGSTKNMSTRDIPSPGFAFKINLNPGEQQSFYLRVNTSANRLQQRFYRQANVVDNSLFLARVWDRNSYDIDKNISENLFGLLVGVFIALMIYNILLLTWARQLTSLYFIAFSASILITLLSMNGRLVQLIDPNYPQFSDLITSIFYPLTILSFALFLKEFVKHQNYPRLNLIGNVSLALCAPILLISYTYGQPFYAQMCDAVAIFISFFYVVLMPIYALIKDRLVFAKYVLISLIPTALSIIDRALFSFGLTDQYYIPYRILTAAVFAMILISCYTGLIAYREKAEAQKSALKQLNISNKLKSDYNVQLEEELEQKTADIRLMNTDLEDKANKLLQLDESKSRFFANISHEFRTPLTLIEGPLNMLLQQKNFSEKRTIESVLRNSNSLKGLIDQVLLLSELDEKSLDLKTSEINVVQAVNEFSAQFDSLAEQKGITLRCDADREVINAYVDYEKLQTIISNLLSNAIKFTQESGQIRVRVSSTVPTSKYPEPASGYKNDYSRDEYVRIVISDSGHGIPESELPFVFDRYFQSASSELSKSGVGTGIGLALVKELVGLHAGEVSVESICESRDNAPLSNGTSFCVTLPLGRAHLSDNEIVQDFKAEKQVSKALAPAPTDQEHTANAATASVKPRATVLVIDDNDDMRNYIQRLLEDQYNVITAQDGLLGEEALSKQLPDLIVTDLMMPNRNGLEFVQAIKSKPEFANIPVIMLTARAGLHDRLKGLMAAIDDYMVKPFDGRELKVRIHNLLNKHAQFSAFYQNQSPELDGLSEVESSNENETYIGKVKAIVNERLIEPDFGVKELAKALHVSENTLRRRLSKQVNFTPAAFIRHCRLEQARHLLQLGKVGSISELAYAVGFNQPSYFSRLYQRTFNTEIEFL